MEPKWKERKKEKEGEEGIKGTGEKVGFHPPPLFHFSTGCLWFHPPPPPAPFCRCHERVLLGHEATHKRTDREEEKKE